MIANSPKGSELESIIEFIRSQESFTEISVPIVSGEYTIGKVTTCLSRHSINQEIEKIILSVLFLNVIVALVLGGVLFTVSRKLIFDPIADLAEAIVRLARGDLSTRITRMATGEVQALFDGFNTMAEDLSQTTVSKDYVDNILGSMTNTLIVVSKDNRIVKVNASTCALLGYDELELVGQPFDVIGSDVASQEAWQNALRDSHHVGNIEDGYRSKAGQTVPVLLSASVMHDANQVLCGIVYVAQDITMLKKFESSLKEARDIAEAASNAKSLFLAHMSHEIRTPMNGILGMTELLLGTPLTAQQKRFVEAVCQSGKNLLDIINSILDFSKIEAGKLELELTDFNLRQIVEDICSLFATQAGAKKINLVGFVPSELPVALRGDQVRLRQVLTNLVGNSIKFTQQGEVNLEVRLTAQARDTAQLRFEVRDTGIGISPEAQRRIFDAFAQADNTTTRHFGGTGLGLTISKLLAEAMGGQLQVSSTPDSGSSFWFEIVLGKQRADARVLKDDSCLSGIQVLVVEGNLSSNEAIQNQLKAWGMECTGCQSGADALFLTSKARRKFDLAIIETQLTDMDGIELAQAITSDEQGQSMRLIMLCPSQGQMPRPHVRVASYLTKPVLQSDLYNAVVSGSAGSKLQAGAAGHQSPATPSHLSRRVLVAEDHPVNQALVMAMLEKMGLEAVISSNGCEALTALEREHFDVILMDCQMPEMDGFMATSAIRATEQSSAAPQHVPIIALTANAQTSDRGRCLAAGMDDYLSKPFTLDQLQAILVRWLPQSEQKAAGHPMLQPLMSASGLGKTPGEGHLNQSALKAIRQLDPENKNGLLAKIIRSYLTDAPPTTGRPPDRDAGVRCQATA